MENAVIILVLALVIGGAIFYIYQAKKRGQKCIGCPYAKECAKKCSCKSEQKTVKSCMNTGRMCIAFKFPSGRCHERKCKYFGR